MIRILLIPSSDYLGHPFPQRHNHLFERLHDGKEFEVHVIRFNIFEKPKLHSRCIIHEIPLEFKTSNTALYYLANIASYTSEILRIVKRESIDIVVAGNLLPPLTYSLAKQLTEKRIPFIFDLQDYYPTSATGYIASTESLLGITLKGVFEAITQHLIRIADVVTVPGIALAMYARKTGAKKVHLVPNGISEHFLQKHNGTEIRKKLGLKENDLVIGYIGSIEFWLDMEPLIKAIAKVYRQGMPVKFLLIGKHLQTGYSHKVENWIKRYGIEKITTWLGFVPYQEVPKYTAAMNIGTIPFNTKNQTAYYAAPNKLWEYLSQGTLVASTPIPETIVHSKIIKFIKVVGNYRDYITTLRHYINGKHSNGYVKSILMKKTWKYNVNILQKLLKSFVLSVQ